jgi:hypothetical protein
VGTTGGEDDRFVAVGFGCLLVGADEWLGRAGPVLRCVEVGAVVLPVPPFVGVNAERVGDVEPASGDWAEAVSEPPEPPTPSAHTTARTRSRGRRTTARRVQ